MRLISLVAVMVLLCASVVLAGNLPLEIKGHYQLKLGNIPDIAGTQDTNVEHTLTFDREIPVEKLGVISLTPYLSGILSAEEFLNDRVVTSAIAGVDALVLQNDKCTVKVGLEVQGINYKKGNDATVMCVKTKVDF